jgi:hypothetical protein
VKGRYWGFLEVYRLLLIPRNLLMELVAGGGYDLPDTSVLPVALGKSNVYNHLQFAANTGQPRNSQCCRENRGWLEATL